jgi:2-methylcitrate dehydratase PrpD
MNITDIFVDYLYGLSVSDLRAEAVEQARLCFLDYKGVTAAGAKMLQKQGNAFLDRVLKQGGNVSVIGFKEKTTLHNAAFINAMSAHMAELDDGHRAGQIHLGASIISALLPVSEVEGLSEDAVLRGIVVGYEAAIRLAMAVNPAHKLQGFHTSGTCGTIGVAVAIAVALKFTREQMKVAVSAATASASGLLEMQEDESELKPYNLANAAVGGITAAYCALAGFKGPDDAIGGKRGFLSVLTENPRIQYLTEFKENYLQIETVYRKLYAACRHAHSAIEAAITLKNGYSIDPASISSILIETYGMAIKGHDHKEIKGIQSAKMSIPFSVALALKTGHAGLVDYKEKNLADEEIHRLMGLIRIVEDPEISSWLPGKRAARVTIVSAGGSFTTCVEYPKGEPENPITESEIIEKNRLWITS